MPSSLQGLRPSERQRLQRQVSESRTNRHSSVDSNLPPYVVSVPEPNPTVLVDDYVVKSPNPPHLL